MAMEIVYVITVLANQIVPANHAIPANQIAPANHAIPANQTSPVQHCHMVVLKSLCYNIVYMYMCMYVHRQSLIFEAIGMCIQL